jgi:hypothetical protein
MGSKNWAATVARKVPTTLPREKLRTTITGAPGVSSTFFLECV